MRKHAIKLVLASAVTIGQIYMLGFLLASEGADPDALLELQMARARELRIPVVSAAAENTFERVYN